MITCYAKWWRDWELEQKTNMHLFHQSKVHMREFTPMITDRSLLNLMNWLSPSFPVGGYAYSHGIEFAVEDGRIKNEQQLVCWVEAALVQGSGRNDGLLFVEGEWGPDRVGVLSKLAALNARGIGIARKKYRYG